MQNLKFKRYRMVFAVSIVLIAVLMAIMVPMTAANETAAPSESPEEAEETAVAGQQGSSNGFLTGSNSGAPVEIAYDYLNDNHADYGLTQADLADTAVTQMYSSPSDFTQVEMQQRLNGIGVYNGMILVNVAADGSIINLHNQFVPDLANKANTTSPDLTAAEAVNAAAAHLGLSPQGLAVETLVGGPAREVLFNDAGISINPIPAKLIYQPVKQEARLAWDIEIYEIDQQNWWSMRVDAISGDVLSQDNYVIHEDFNAQAAEAHGTTEFENTAQSTAVAHSVQDNSGAPFYWVYEWPRESPLHNPQGPAGPPDEGRTVQVSPWNDASPSPLPSPYGWHDTNGAAGAEFTVTRGNNVDAYEDGNNPGYQPDCGAGLDCASSPLFDVDLSQSPDTYEAAAITNLFYWNNIIHDMTYLYGFDEPARNFQENNYGNGGAGSDYVNAEAQDGSGNCNANFATPGDGSNPRMQMYTCNNATPSRDGDFDNAVIVHEYAHGISNRLTGGANVTCLQNSEQMGEGWSDWLSLMMTIEAGDLGTDSRGMGTYLFGQPPNGPGIRPNPYSTDFGVNPTTYGDIGGLAVPHGVGYAWATILWEMNWELINNGVSTSGLDPDIYNGTGANNLTTQLVMDGMKLQPCSPGFVDGRDAILLADQNLTGGQNQCVIWDAFARRGLGFSADQGSSGSTSDGTEAFDLPPICLQTLKIDKSASPSPVMAGTILTYDLVATNDTTGTLTGVVMDDTIEAGQTYVGASATCGGSETAGVVTFPLGTMTPGQVIACSFQVLVDGGLGSTEYFFDDMESGAGNWATSGSGNTWALVGTNPYSGSTSWFADDIASVTDQYLDMTSAVALSGAPTLRVWHHYDTESNYDGGVIEISADGGSTWTDLGSLMTQNGYNSTISTSYGSPIGGRHAFSGNSGDYLETLADLSSYSGQSVLIRFRMATDSSVSDNGWFVDDVQIIDEASVSNTACVNAVEGDNACDSVVTLVEPSVCSAPTAVTDLTVNLNANGTDIDLNWTSTGADHYDIHRELNDFYFSPNVGTIITASAATSYTDTDPNIIGDPAKNYSYNVVGVNNCAPVNGNHSSGGGGIPSLPSNRVGEFDFGIVTDAP